MSIMYVTLTDIQNGESVYLTRSFSGQLEVALCELTYYHLLHNIRGTECSNEHTTMLVPDGYYNAHELDEEVFKPLGAKLHLDTHTGLLQLTTKNDKIVMSSELAKVLGFPKILSKPKKCSLGMVRPDPAKHTPLTSHTGWLREVYIQLAELSTSGNLTNGQLVLKTGNGKRGSLKMVSEFPQRESSVWGYLCRRSSLRSFLEMGLTTSLMSYPASSSSGHKIRKSRGWN